MNGKLQIQGGCVRARRRPFIGWQIVSLSRAAIHLLIAPQGLDLDDLKTRAFQVTLWAHLLSRLLTIFGRTSAHREEPHYDKHRVRSILDFLRHVRGSAKGRF